MGSRERLRKGGGGQGEWLHAGEKAVDVRFERRRRGVVRTLARPLGGFLTHISDLHRLLDHVEISFF